jgi:alpha-glucosidase
VIRRMRSMIDEYPGSRVLIGETYLPNTAELDKWYGGEKHDELQLPMDMIVGFHAEAGKSKLDASYLRRCVTEAETETHGSQPLFVFNNHDNDRSHDRYGDGVHDEAIDKLIAMLLLTSRSTALMYYGEELGMVTTKPTRVEDVKDPIGVTGWPKEKGRDGERTPMQWDASNAAGFSKNVKTWLPVPPSYKTLNVSAEEQSPDSLLNWYKQLIAMRRSMPALHDGGVVMLDTDNPSVLSYVRTSPAGGKAVLVSLNMSATEQTIHLVVPNRKSGQPVKTLLTKDAALQPAAETIDVVLQPYGSWSGELQ